MLISYLSPIDLLFCIDLVSITYSSPIGLILSSYQTHIDLLSISYRLLLISHIDLMSTSYRYNVNMILISYQTHTIDNMAISREIDLPPPMIHIPTSHSTTLNIICLPLWSEKLVWSSHQIEQYFIYSLHCILYFAFHDYNLRRQGSIPEGEECARL